MFHVNPPTQQPLATDIPQQFIQPPTATPAEPATPTPPVAPPEPTPPTKKVLLPKSWLVIAAILLIPYYAYQNMIERTTSDVGVVVDPQAPITLHAGDRVTYLDKTVHPCDGYGMLVLTWDDYKAQEERFAAMSSLIPESFPVVLFFNASGFDTTGDPIVVRRVANGQVVFSSQRAVPLVRRCIPQRDGSFLVVNADGTSQTVSERVWYTKYMGLQEQQPVTEKPPSPDEPKPAEMKTGLRGQVFKPTASGIERLAGASVLVFRGSISPKDSVDSKPVAVVTVAKDGSYSVSLPPGTYTVALVLDGKIYGNARDQSTWPTVEVTDSIVDYDVRFAQELVIP